VIPVTDDAVGTVRLVTLAADEAHVWLFSLDRPPADTDRLRGLLSNAERERAGPAPLPIRKRRYAVRQGTVREILARYAGCAPEQLELTRSLRGKPALAGGPAFSLSDSGDLGLVALAACEIGVDLERVVDRPIARRSGEPLRRFYERWTAREASAKAVDESLLEAEPAGAIHRAPIHAGPGFVATLATCERVQRIHTRHWPAQG
jgi:phosphopantetheinyl transferase